MEPVLSRESKSQDVHADTNKETHAVLVTAATDVPPEPPTRRIGEGKWYRSFFEPGSAAQIVVAAIIAVAIGMAVNVSVDSVPTEAIAIVGIPGRLWLRALQAVVLPLIITAMILAVQRLREMANGGRKLAKWTVLWYVGTTLVAIVHSTIMVSLVWRRLFREVGAESLLADAASQALIDERQKVAIHQVVVDMFDSFIPNNIVQATASNALLSVLITAIVIGYLVEGPQSIIIQLVKEIERIITIIITFLIKIAPIGVFFLILSNLMRLNLADVGINLGILIGSTIAQLMFHLLLMLPLGYFLIVRRNPYAMWIRCSQAWITAWGTASSAATLPVTMKCAIKEGVPITIAKFSVPLGCLINMDGTAIYFPVVVVFMAQTQGIQLNPAEYVIVVLLSTLASIGVTPIPSASLVLIVMICSSINLPVTGMYAVVVAIDWFLDRFRTATNVSGDLYAAGIVAKITGITDSVEEQLSPEEAAAQAQEMYDREMRQ